MATYSPKYASRTNAAQTQGLIQVFPGVSSAHRRELAEKFGFQFDGLYNGVRKFAATEFDEMATVITTLEADYGFRKA